MCPTRGSEQCPRVQLRIECPECWYPAGEALYYLCEGGCKLWGAEFLCTDPGCFPGETLSTIRSKEVKQTIVVTFRDGRFVVLYDAWQPHFFQTGTCGTFVIKGRREGATNRTEFVFWESDVRCIESQGEPS